MGLGRKKKQRCLPIKTRSCKKGRPIVVVVSSNISEHIMSELLIQLRRYFTDIQLIKASGAIKGCMVANGDVDLYPRYGRTSEWDTAAFHAVVIGAGGNMINMQGKVLKYNCGASLLNPDFLRRRGCGYKVASFYGA